MIEIAAGQVDWGLICWAGLMRGDMMQYGEADGAGYVHSFGLEDP